MFLIMALVCASCSHNYSIDELGGGGPVTTDVITDTPVPVPTTEQTSVPSVNTPIQEDEKEPWVITPVEVVVADKERDETEALMLEDIKRLVEVQHCSRKDIEDTIVTAGYEEYLYLLDEIDVSFKDVAVERGISMCAEGVASPVSLRNLLTEAGFTEEESSKATEVLLDNVNWSEIAVSYCDELLSSGIGPDRVAAELINEGFTEDETNEAISNLSGQLYETAQTVFENWLAGGWSTAEAKALMREAGWTSEYLDGVSVPTPTAEEPSGGEESALSVE